MTNLTLLIGGLGTGELLIILAIVVLVFGVGKLPEVGRQMGQGIRNFKKEMNSVEDDLSIEDKTDEQHSVPQDVSAREQTVVEADKIERS